MSVTLQHIRTFLRSHTPKRVDTSGLRKSAVLFLFVQAEKELHILLTKRTDLVEHHKGQISFPGGMMDPGDANLQETALRETEEEIGLPREHVELLGLLDEYESPSGFVITPVVGLLTGSPAFSLSAAEVEEVFTVPVGFFLEPGVEESFQREWKGEMRDVFAYQFGNHRIWGVTAAIIRSFLRKVADAVR